MGVEPFLSSQSLGSSIPLEVVYAPSWFGGVSVGRHRHGTRHPGGCHWCRSGVNDPFRLGVYDAFLHRLVFGWHHFCLCSLRLEWPSWPGLFSRCEPVHRHLWLEGALERILYYDFGLPMASSPPCGLDWNPAVAAVTRCLPMCQQDAISTGFSVDSRWVYAIPWLSVGCFA